MDLQGNLMGQRPRCVVWPGTGLRLACEPNGASTAEAHYTFCVRGRKDLLELKMILQNSREETPVEVAAGVENPGYCARCLAK
jgi:hypothetical protein